MTRASDLHSEGRGFEPHRVHLINHLIMNSFDYKDGELICKRCGSKNVSVRCGMMTDRAYCKDCGNEDYI